MMQARRALQDKAREAVDLARRHQLTLVTAESCTTGMLATLLADSPGAGDCVLGGFVTYAKSCKVQVLGVSKSLLQEKTAVSAEVAEAMARGALQHCSAALSIAITGVAGPEPDEDGNPVGLTFVACARRDGGACYARHRFSASERADNRALALDAALDLLLQTIRTGA